MIYLIDITNIGKICDLAGHKFKFPYNLIGCVAQEGEFDGPKFNRPPVPTSEWQENP